MTLLGTIRRLLVIVRQRPQPAGGTDFDSIAANLGPLSFDSMGGRPPRVKHGSGWRAWSTLLERRSGVAGANLVLIDIASQLEDFIDAVRDLVEVEIDKANVGHYRFAGDTADRNRAHRETVDAVEFELRTAIQHLENAEMTLVDRWSTWPSPSEAER